jgi:hypothetical protein
MDTVEPSNFNVTDFAEFHGKAQFIQRMSKNEFHRPRAVSECSSSASNI